MATQPEPHRPQHLTAEPDHDLIAIEITGCPVCEHPAEILRRFVLESTDGPLEHVKIRCLIGHGFLMPVELLGQDLG